jgi:hypothetical protein
MDTVEADSQILPAQPSIRSEEDTVPISDTNEPTVNDSPSQRTPGTEPYSGGGKTRRRRKRKGTRKQSGGFKKEVAFVGKPWSGGNTKTWGKSNYYAKNNKVMAPPNPSR